MSSLVPNTPGPLPPPPFVWLSDTPSLATTLAGSSTPLMPPITIALAGPPTYSPPIIYYITANSIYLPDVKLDWCMRVITTQQDTIIHTKAARWFSWPSSSAPTALPGPSRGLYLTNIVGQTQFNPTTSGKPTFYFIMLYCAFSCFFLLF